MWKKNLTPAALRLCEDMEINQQKKERLKASRKYNNIFYQLTKQKKQNQR